MDWSFSCSCYINEALRYQHYYYGTDTYRGEVLPSLANLGNSSKLLSEALLFISSASPSMWGITTPRPQRQEGSARTQCTNSMLFSPSMSQGLMFRAGGMPVELCVRGGVLLDTVHEMLGRPPLPPRVITATPQMQQQQQQQMLQSQQYMPLKQPQ